MNVRLTVNRAARRLTNVLGRARMDDKHRKALREIIAGLEALGKDMSPPPPAKPKRKGGRKKVKPADLRETADDKRAQGRDIRMTEF